MPQYMKQATLSGCQFRDMHIVTRLCMLSMKGGQNVSQGLVAVGFLEREPVLTGYDSW